MIQIISKQNCSLPICIRPLSPCRVYFGSQKHFFYNSQSSLPTRIVSFATLLSFHSILSLYTNLIFLCQQATPPSSSNLSPSLTSFFYSSTKFLWEPILQRFLSPSGDLGISLVWHNLSPPHPTGPHRHFSVRLLKSSSKWTKLSMRGPQLFSGWYQMIFRLGSD